MVDWGMVGTIAAVVVPVSGGLIAFGSIKTRLTSHEELDNARFQSLKEDIADQKEMIKEVRDDVKAVLRNGKKEE